MPDGPDLLPPGHPLLPAALDHVTPGFRGLWFAGDPTTLAHGPRIGVIGSRHPRSDAADAARRIARDAARAGFVVVSGLAIGIDGYAHQAALDGGARTIAVLGGGLGKVQPASNRRLARAIAGAGDALGVAAGMHAGARGVVVSEYGPGQQEAHPYRFRERNRIIAALSDYLVVVQARHRSGSMLTAEAALSLGVQIGVLPSSPDDPCHAGTTALIHDGADAVVDGASLFRRLELHGIVPAGFAAAAVRGARIDRAAPRGWVGGDEPRQLAFDDHPLLQALDAPLTIDELVDRSGGGLAIVRRQLLELEDAGHACHCDDGTWRRVT